MTNLLKQSYEKIKKKDPSQFSFIPVYRFDSNRGIDATKK